MPVLTNQTAFVEIMGRNVPGTDPVNGVPSGSFPAMFYQGKKSEIKFHFDKPNDISPL